jgi:hypothetical protein
VTRRPKSPDALRRTTLFRTLQRLMARGEPAIRRAVLGAIIAVQNGTRIAAVQAAMARGDVDAAVEVIPWDMLQRGPYANRLSQSLRSVYAPIGAAEIRAVGGRSFTVLNPRGLRFLRDRGAELVVQITRDTREGLRTTVTRMLARGLPAQQAAALIRPQVGLYDTLQIALDTYTDKLLKKGLDAATVQQETERYATELRQYRAMNIARTEAAFSANVAHREAWEQAAEQDLFDPATATRVWVATPGENTCPICSGMDGVEVGFNEPFTQRKDGTPYQPTYAGKSALFDASYMLGDPPAHPNCACLTVLRPGV